jgi:hypothetical protein
MSELPRDADWLMAGAKCRNVRYDELTLSALKTNRGWGSGEKAVRPFHLDHFERDVRSRTVSQAKVTLIRTGGESKKKLFSDDHRPHPEKQ